MLQGSDYVKDSPKDPLIVPLVVQLFNAIKAQQKATEELTERTRPITTNAKDKGVDRNALSCTIRRVAVPWFLLTPPPMPSLSLIVANLTKASFLDLLKSGTKVSTV